MYGELGLFIDGAWKKNGGGNKGEDVINPATEKPLAHLPHASKADLDEALESAKKGFAVWRATSAYDRCKIMHKAADLMRERHDAISKIMVLEQGKPYPEARGEVIVSADIIDWYAEEGRRSLWPHRAGPRQGRPPARDAGADRRGRGVHAVEFPGADAGPQGRRRARGRLLADPEGVGRDARRLRRDGEVLRRRGPARGRAQSGVRRAGRSVRASARQGRGAQDFLHRLDPGRQASRRSSPPRA